MSAEPQNKKQKYTQNKKHYYGKKKNWLEVGMRGFFATCNFRERDCVRECYNVLNHYADILYGPLEQEKNTEAQDASVDNDLDIADTLQQQIDAEKQKTRTSKDAVKHRFQQVDTGANNCIFVSTTLENPVELAQHIVADIADTKQQKTRFLLRLVPVDVVCRANMNDIMKAAGVLFDKHFLKESCTFSIAFNRRLNESIKREDILADLAGLVLSMNTGNRVDLKNAEKTVIVEIIKGLCLLSVIKGYATHKKYNLIELANPTKPEHDEVKHNVVDEVNVENATKVEAAESDDKINTSAER